MGFHRIGAAKSPKWKHVQADKTAGYDFAAFDEIIGRLNQEAGVELMATISSNVDWDQDECHPDRQGPMYPCNVAMYEDYLRAVAERYDGDVDYGCSQPSPDCYQPGDGQYPTWNPLQRARVSSWQLENELDSTPYWADTAANYAQLLELTNSTIKGVCPDCRIVVAGQTSQGFRTRTYDMSPFYKEVFDSLSGQYFDVVDNHLYKKRGDYNVYRGRHDEYVAHLAGNGFTDVDYWVTEMATWSGTPSTDLGYQSEEDQATELVKRFVYSFASGVTKVCWSKIMEYGWYQGEVCNRFNFTDLINNPLSPEDCSDPNDPTGFGISDKKLAYYTLKLLIEKLAGSQWGSIEIIGEADNVYVYRFTAAGRPVYVAWWDWFNDIGEGRTITLDMPDVPTGFVTITEAVPNASSGGDLQDETYPLFFNSVQVPLPAPPYVPSAPSPADGAPEVWVVSPVLGWSGGDPNDDPVYYDLYFGKSDPPRLKLMGLAEETFTLGKLCCDTPYYWRVVAREALGETSPGPVWSFTTTDQGCPVIESLAPNPCAPSDVATISGRNFGSTKGVVKVGKRRIKRRKIKSWTNTRVDFLVPPYNSLASGASKTKKVMVKAGPRGSRLKSNKVPLTIIRP